MRTLVLWMGILVDRDPIAKRATAPKHGTLLCHHFCSRLAFASLRSSTSLATAAVPHPKHIHALYMPIEKCVAPPLGAPQWTNIRHTHLDTKTVWESHEYGVRRRYATTCCYISFTGFRM